MSAMTCLVWTGRGVVAMATVGVAMLGAGCLSSELVGGDYDDNAVVPEIVMPDEHPAVERDGGKGGAPVDGGLPSEPPACETDDDCCTVVDRCSSTVYLTGRDGQQSVRDWVEAHQDMERCNACLAPMVQVRCVEHSCRGERVEGRPGGGKSNVPNLGSSHCGYIQPPADAGVRAYGAALAGAEAEAGARMRWTCGD